MFNLGDADFIKESIEEIDDYISEDVAIFTVSGSSGTLASLEPRTITWGSTEIKASAKRVSAREINEAGGIYKADDLFLYSTGSYSQDAKVVWRSGTYNVIEKPVPTYIADNDVRWKGVLRRA